MDPEPVQAGLLDRDDREGPVQTSRRLLLKLSEPREQAADVARRDHVLGQLFAGARRQGGDQPG